MQAINKPYRGVLDGSKWDKQTLPELLKSVLDFQKKYNVPIFVGEFSAICWLPVQSSVNWLTDVIGLFEEYQWSLKYNFNQKRYGDEKNEPVSHDFWAVIVQ